MRANVCCVSLLRACYTLQYLHVPVSFSCTPDRQIQVWKRNTQASISEAHTTRGGSERERTCLHFVLLVFVGAGQLLSRVGRELGVVWEEELGEAILIPRVCSGSVRVWWVGAGGGGGNTLPLVGMCRILEKKRSGVSTDVLPHVQEQNVNLNGVAHIIGCQYATL